MSGILGWCQFPQRILYVLRGFDVVYISHIFSDRSFYPIVLMAY